MRLEDYRRRAAEEVCLWCDTPLDGEIRHYPHRAGWAVEGFPDRQWLSAACGACGYEWSFAKLGIPRDAMDPGDEAQRRLSCQACGREVSGEVTVSESLLPGGIRVVRLESTPDRDWICCDGCNALLCHGCCLYPGSGYCDSCIARYRLYGHLVEAGLIRPLRPGR